MADDAQYACIYRVRGTRVTVEYGSNRSTTNDYERFHCRETILLELAPAVPTAARVELGAVIG
jgi:hypothetical protein